MSSRIRSQFIPDDRLPPGFAARIEAPAEPAAAKPAATAVLMRDHADGPEVFLLRRNRSSGFVPGAYVFPGGRVDPADSDETLVARAVGLPASPPAPFWMAAVRETFEETGVLLARGGRAPRTDELAEWRDALLEDRTTLRDVLAAFDARAALERMVSIAHWITPVAEPRRYDTHFFLAATPDGAEATGDAREMSDAIWIRPADALDRFGSGRLPMVFPTVHTLETLVDYDSVDAALDALRRTEVRPILPRLIRSDGGVRSVIDDEESED